MYLRKRRYREADRSSLLELKNLTVLLNVPELKPMSYALPCNHYPFIEDGYRVNYSYKDCLISMFTFHNDTMNIWSHLLGMICLIVAGIAIFAEYQSADVPFHSRFALGAYIACAAICMLFSVVYHTFSVISHDHHTWLLTLDIGGVSFLTGGSVFVWISYGFYCDPTIRSIYSVFSVLLGSLGMYVAFNGADHSPAGIKFRVVAFLVIGSLIVIPISHWWWVTPDYIKYGQMTGLFGTFIFYLIGVCFYVFRFPENCFPKSFLAQQIFHSHLWWHLMVCAAVTSLLVQAIDYQSLMAQHYCDATVLKPLTNIWEYTSE